MRTEYVFTDENLDYKEKCKKENGIYLQCQT